MPTVTWIDMQPESSARTSLKSFADYLTETQDDAAVFTPTNRLCLSPETLDALDSAEKLIDDVERQLSQMHFDDSLTDDTEEDRFNGIRLSDERLHVQDVVKTVFQKGYYEPAARPVFKQDNAAWKHKRGKASSASNFKSSKVSSKPIVRRIEPLHLDECLLCKSNIGAESAKQLAIDEHKAEGASAVGHALQETKINADKPEKLNVQKAPTISIKGPLTVQTARIVDIQPAQRIPAKHTKCTNIVTHECRHLEASASIIHASQLEQSALQIPRDQPKSINKSALDYSRESVDKENRSWPECEHVQLELDDFSLREPTILVEVDAVLEQQRNIIRQVHEATDKFDRFLARRMPQESADSSLDEVEDSLQARPTKKQKYPRKCNKPFKVVSAIDDELDRNKTIDTRRETSPSTSRESLKPTESASFSRRIINCKRAAESNSRNSSSTALSEAANQTFQDSNKQNLAVPRKSSTQQSKDALYSESFESESSGDASKSNKSQCLELESGIQLKNTHRQISSNNSSIVQSPVDTETQSNTGFVENLKSSQNLNENNLAINRRQKAKVSRHGLSMSIENGNVDKNLNLNEDCSGNIREKCDDQKQLDGKKILNELHITETDDERELHNYQFDADLLEGENEQANEPNNKVHEKIDVDIEGKKDKSTEKFQGHLEENSQKTSHLIDSISDISFHGSSERAENTQESQKVLSASNHEFSEPKENSMQEAAKELSTESKIEMKLSEARDNLKILMKTINSPVNNEANDERKSVQEPYKIIEMHRQSADNDVPQIMKNITLRTNDARRQNCRMLTSPSVISKEDKNLPNDRSFIDLLQENSDAVQNSFERHKLLLLTNLESCSIKSPSRGKRVFTSTIVDDADPPGSCNFTRSKGSSTIRQDSSSDSHSEGEIRLGSSTASYSLGEIRRKIVETNSSCSTKGSTTNSSANLNNSSSRSAGELNGLTKNEIITTDSYH